MSVATFQDRTNEFIHVCRVCGWQEESNSPSYGSHKCRTETVSAAGDALEQLLTSHGITKEWWTEYKSKHGLPPTCGCDSRRDYLNKLSQAHPNLAKYGVMVFRALSRKKP